MTPCVGLVGSGCRDHTGEADKCSGLTVSYGILGTAL